MQILINVDESLFAKGFEHPFTDKEKMILLNAIGEGTPLPREHGDLVDRNAINNQFESIYQEATQCSNRPTWEYLFDKLLMCIDDAQPIINNNYKEAEEEELWK